MSPCTQNLRCCTLFQCITKPTVFNQTCLAQDIVPIAQYFLVLHANKSCHMATEILYPHIMTSKSTRFLSKFCTGQYALVRWLWAIFSLLQVTVITTSKAIILFNRKIILTTNMGKYCRLQSKAIILFKRKIM